MSYKIINMQKIIGTALVLSLVWLMAACGSSAKDKKGELGDKKAKLEKLKKEKNKLDADIHALEAEIAIADPNAAAIQKLVSVDTVAIQDFIHYIELQGRVDAENVAYVSPRGMGGTIKAIYVQEGQVVRKGQLLMKLDDAIARQAVAAAQQQVAGADAQAKLAQSVYERQQNLWRQNIGTEVQVLQAKTNADAALSQFNAAKANVNMAQEQVNQSNVFAEISGTVDQLNVKPGEFFSPQSAAMPISGIRIVNTSDLKIKVLVPENYLSKISVGKPLQVVLPELNNRIITSKVTVAGKLIDPTTRSFSVEGKLPADKDLRPNQIATVKIEDYKSLNTITVPVNIVQTDEKGKYLFIAETNGGKTVARKKIVTVGEAYGGQIEIKSGLKGGEKIITQGYQTVYEGQAITTAK
jgi:membrane fusion protein (multidrug efflux system)